MSNKIINLVSKKNLSSFPRILNKADADNKYFIDTLKNIDGLERLFSSTNTSDLGVTIDDISWNGVEFDNQPDFKIETVVPLNLTEEGVFESEYKLSGSPSIFTEAQRSVYGTAVVAGETTFIVVNYSDNLVQAKARQTFWTTEKDDISTKIGYAGLKSVNGLEETVLGISGPGTVNNGAQFWHVVILDENSEDGNIIAHYIFDLTSMITPVED